MKYNNELQLIDTKEKAYLLGFLYGDGTISTYLSNNKRRYQIKISILMKDKNIINKLHKNFNFFNKGKFDYSKYNKNTGIQISLSSCSKKLYDDLMLNGLYPRKSYENKDKLQLPNIDNKLISHFIRGFFDADGSVYVQNTRKNLIRIEFCSVAKNFIYEINELLKLNNINSWKIIKKSYSGKQDLYVLTFIKTSEVQKLIEFMYNDATIYLERKANKCLSYKPVDKVLDRNINCPSCNSTKVWSNGVRNKSTRFKCHDCGKGFSIKNYSK